MRADNLRRGGVDEIPVVDELRIREIERVDRVAIATLVLLGENHDGEQSLFVPFGVQERQQLVECQRTEFANDRAQVRDADAEELIAFAVLAGACLEESATDGCALFACEVAQPPRRFRCFRRSRGRTHWSRPSLRLPSSARGRTSPSSAEWF